MTYKKNFFLFLAAIPVIAVLDAAAGIAGIKTHFYIWELLFDGKTFLLAALFVLLLKPAQWGNAAKETGVVRWSFLKNTAAFMIPALLSCTIAGAGMLAKKVSYADPDNGATVLLTMIFDIPAIFIFSVTTIFVEEFLFRGMIFSEFERNDSAGAGLVVSSILWAIYAFADVLPLEEFTWMSVGILLLFFLAVGIASASLYFISRTIWVSYAFRIGILTVTPTLVSGVTGATDAFFATENIFFFGDGIIASAALIVLFTAVFFAVLYKRKKQAEVAFAPQ